MTRVTYTKPGTRQRQRSATGISDRDQRQLQGAAAEISGANRVSDDGRLALQLVILSEAHGRVEESMGEKVPTPMDPSAPSLRSSGRDDKLRAASPLRQREDVCLAICVRLRDPRFLLGWADGAYDLLPVTGRADGACDL